MSYPLLSTVNDPRDLRKITTQELPALADELRRFIQEETHTKEAHIRSSLGVVELSIALHYVFNTPEDILIWDVGHQAYAHKVLTGRRTNFHTNRQKGGISGFTKRAESSYDPFGAGHSSTSISALAGFLKSAQLAGKRRKHLAVIGDGALTGGQAFEALNYLGAEKQPCIIILNDNQGSIDPNVGALQALESYKAWANSLGFEYLFEAQGNDLPALLKVLKEAQALEGPVFLHIHTQKGLGFRKEIERKKAPSAPSFQEDFGAYIKERLALDPSLVVLSPAMLAGANLLEAKAAFPDRVIDVGIAEQHVVTMAASLAADGMKPLVHLYSTFAQRAYDQIVHDVVLQSLPVIFIFDRAGLVGEDGPTHHGLFDQSMLSDLPNIRMGAPANGKALRAMLDWAFDDLQGPLFLRYPKDSYHKKHEALWRSYRPHWWHEASKERVLISYGSTASLVQEVAEEADWGHLHLPVFRPAPIGDLVEQLKKAQAICLVDENPSGGSLDREIKELIAKGELETKYSSVLLPRQFVEHAGRQGQLEGLGFSKPLLLRMLKKILDR